MHLPQGLLEPFGCLGRNFPVDVDDRLTPVVAIDSSAMISPADLELTERILLRLLSRCLARQREKQDCRHEGIDTAECSRKPHVVPICATTAAAQGRLAPYPHNLANTRQRQRRRTRSSKQRTIRQQPC